MGDESGVVEAAALGDRSGSRNGGDPSRGDGSGLLGRLAGPIAGPAVSALGRVAAPLLEQIGNRLNADLDDRDPDFIREKLPLFWLLASTWFRGEVRNLGRIPEDRPVLLVGNHSGGNLTPDTMVFTLAFCAYFGVERRFYQLAHNLVLASPYGQLLRKFGTVAASHENADRALRSGGALLVYPGGDWEVHRPSWQSGEVDFANRKGFIKLALNEGVDIVPVVSVGGQETALFLSQGEHISKLLRLDKLFRLKVLPISIAPPWGLNVGDFFGHFPLPAKITIDVLEPINLRKQFGRDPDIDEVYEHVTGTMQTSLDGLSAERRVPVLG
ncbi:MAG: lysophospholipid acyltransferase family protein [Solirubrobacterales bacterium]